MEKQKFSVGSSVWWLAELPDGTAYAVSNYTTLDSFMHKGTVWCCELQRGDELIYKIQSGSDVLGASQVVWCRSNELYPSKAAAKREAVNRLLSSLEEREQQANRLIRQIHTATAKLLGEEYGEQ